METIEKKYISYDQYDRLIYKFTDLLQTVKPDVILAIPRGGLAIGLHVSHYLECKYLLTLKINNEFAKLLSQLKGLKLLIVDDVCDSGETLKNNIISLHNCKITDIITATLHVKPRRSITPDFFVEEVPNDCWLVYPWEFDNIPNKEYMK